MNYESKMNSYKTSELECLEKIPSIYDYMVSLNEFKKIDLIYAGIILGDKYNDYNGKIQKIAMQSHPFLSIQQISDTIHPFYGTNRIFPTSHKSKK